MKRYIALLIVLMGIFCSGCAIVSENPDQVNVVGMELRDAAKVLSREGWEIQTTDDTPHSDYFPGSYEDGQTQYGGCKVTRVEFFPSEQSKYRGYVTVPSCMIHIESGDQGSLEDLYITDFEIYVNWYIKFLEELLYEGPSDSLARNVSEAHDYLESYDEDSIPISRKRDHWELTSRYAALIDILCYFDVSFD